MEDLLSADTERDGTTTITTMHHIRLVLSPQATQLLLNHLLSVSFITATIVKT